jgi:hypothetical protein
MGERGRACSGECVGGNVVAFPSRPTQHHGASDPERRLLIAEALAIEGQYGKNAYSDYVLKHGRRPNRAEAAGLGRRLGGQVRADDGSMQPPLSKGDRAALRAIKSRRKAASRRYDHIMRLQQAIAALSENKDDPAEIIGAGSCLFLDSDIGTQLDAAVCWLNRFARAWHDREKETGTGNAEPSGRD